MPKYIKLETEANVSNATPPQGAISLFYTQQNNKVTPKAKLSNGTIVSLSGSNTEEVLTSAVIEVTDSTPLDRKAAGKFKLKVSGQYTPTFANWNEGDEGYLVLYAGSKVSIPPLLQWDGTEKGETQFAVVRVFSIEGNMLASVIYEAGVVELITEEQLTALALQTATLTENTSTFDESTITTTDLNTLQQEVQTVSQDISVLSGYTIEEIQNLETLNNNVSTL